ncbi:unnamed protein product [Nesidiocoris tenuis]|uniref:Uncharacterized protein n=1 Tax=Nesidiocoris tenuis TaxID=355587 RepID=A0A6H5HPJ2_9HEMI|nr:unnamed protein product [Nesidiocoris tenuis]
MRHLEAAGATKLPATRISEEVNHGEAFLQRCSTAEQSSPGWGITRGNKAASSHRRHPDEPYPLEAEVMLKFAKTCKRTR